MASGSAAPASEEESSGTFPVGPLSWPGKILPPHSTGQGDENRQGLFLFFQVFSWALPFLELSQRMKPPQEVVLSQMLLLSPLFIPYLPRLPVQKPSSFAWFALCLLGRMNPERCVYPAHGKHPNIWLNSQKCDMRCPPLPRPDYHQVM